MTRLTPGPAKAGAKTTWLAGMLVILVAILFLAFPLAAHAATYNSQEIEFFNLINQYRQSNGLGKLLLSDRLSDSSQKHNLDMAKYKFFSHTSVQSSYFPAGASPWDRMAACGYNYNTYKGENIAGGQSTASQVFNAWKNSSGHRANMLNGNFKVIGISFDNVAGSPYRYYWTTDFGGYVDPTAHTPGGTGGGTTTTTTTRPATDTTKPTVSFKAPTNGATVGGRVTIEVAASDNVRVAKVELYLDGQLAASDTTSPYVFTWTTSAASNGAHTLKAKAYDAAGNTQESSIKVTVKNTTTTTTTRSTTTTTTSPPPGGQTRTFADVSPTHEFYDEISTVVSANIMTGYGNGYFGPDDYLARAQFAKIIVLALGLHTEKIDNANSPTFPDVTFEGDSYPFDYVEEAAKAGIVLGRDDGTFDPYGSITRVQLVLMLVRAGGGKLATPPGGYSHGLDDIPAFAEAAVRVARYNGLLSGIIAESEFDPYALATRGQAAKMTCNLLEALGG